MPLKGFIGVYIEVYGVYGSPNNRVLGPKYININGICALKPYYLGPWGLGLGLLGLGSRV